VGHVHADITWVIRQLELGTVAGTELDDRFDRIGGDKLVQYLGFECGELAI
jgi:hypothetical protein